MAYKLYKLFMEEFSPSSLKSWDLDSEKNIKKNIIDNYEINYEEPIKITSSSGAILVIIFPNFVLKVFNNEITLNNVISLIKCGENCKYIINCYKVIKKNNFNAIVTNVLEPLLDWSFSKPILVYNINNINLLLTLLIQIGIALDILHKNGYTHGDCTLDNIGVYNDHFMLFDFNCGKLKDGSSKNDIHLLLKSIENKKELNEISKDLLLFLNNLVNLNGDNLVKNTISYYRKIYDINLSDENIIELLNKNIPKKLKI